MEHFNLWHYKIMKVVIPLIILLFLSCSTKMSTGKKTFDLQGHRGSRGLMPENTIPAMIKAVEMGVNTLEMDAVITADEQVILSHEPFFNHEITTRADGSFVTEAEEKTFNIYQMTFDQLAGFDVGSKVHSRFAEQQKFKVAKPKLSSVIDSVEAFCKANHHPLPFYNIETKSNPSTDNQFHPLPEKFVDLIMKVIVEKGIQSRTIIQSFDPRTLRYLHRVHPNIKTALLIEEYDKRPLNIQLEDLGFLPTIYSPAMELVTPQIIDACHAKKIKVIPWTVNDVADMKRLKQMGVDGLITDYPDRFLKGVN